MVFEPNLNWVNDSPPGFTAAEMIRIQQGLADVSNLVGTPTDTAVAAIMGNGASASRVVTDATYAAQQFLGMTFPGIIDNAAALQAAADVAAADGSKLVTAGIITTASTLTLKSAADLSQLTINYSGTGVAVQVQGSTLALPLGPVTISLPTVLCTNKPGVGWTAGTVGVRLLNVSSCDIKVKAVRNFETGLDMTANVTGNVYNTVTIGALDNNKVNLWINPTGGGWVNQNTFIGGRYAHYSGEGLGVVGTKHINITQGTGSVANMNVWVNPSVETGPGIVEYGIDIEAGMYNVFQNPRVEANGADPYDRVAVRWGPGAHKNVIRDGYSLATKLRQVYAGGTANYIDSQTLVEHGASSSPGTAFRRYENVSSSAYPTHAGYDAGTFGDPAGYDPALDYAWSLSTKGLTGKIKTDANPRVQVDFYYGRTYYGNGVGALAKYIGNLGSNICVSGTSLLFSTHNTYDLGSAAFAPRSLYAGTSTVTAGITTTYGTAAPTAGAQVVGNECKNSTPAVGSPKSWVCTAAGTPGTWVSTGNL